MIRRTAATCVAALSVAAALAGSTPASAASATAPSTHSLTIQQLRAELAQRSAVQRHDVAGRTAAAKAVPVAFGASDPQQMVEGTSFSVTFQVTSPDAGAPGAVAPTGDVTFYDVNDPYKGRPDFVELTSVSLSPVPGVTGASSATLENVALQELHDVAMSYSGDANYDVITTDDGVRAGAEVVFSGNNGGARQLLERLYFDLLNRRFDPAGFDYWLPSVQAGRYNDAAFAFATSAERLGLEVDNTYLAVLGRAADAGGKAYYVDLFTKGVTVQALEVDLASSKEFRDAYPNNGDAVEALYRGILNRAADPGGKAYYTGLLASGKATLGSVAYDLAYSDEALRLVVTRLYAEVLERSPDSGGLAYWTRQLRSGYRQELISFSMTQSPEYLALLEP